MATIPVVNDFDKRKGIITSVIVLLLLWIYLILATYEMADPPPRDIPLKTTPIVEELVLKNLKVESGSSGGGTPSDAPVSESKPQTEKVISSKKENNTKVNSGESNVTNTHNSNNSASTTQQSNNPFGDGGSGNGTGGGTGNGFGNDSGTGGSGDGPGPGAGAKNRHKVHDINPDDLESNVSAVIAYKVTVDQYGNVIAAEVISGKTTTSDQKLINRTRAAILNDLKYNVVKNASLVTLVYTVNVLPR